MKPEDVLDEIGKIDPSYVEEAEEAYQSRKKRRRLQSKKPFLVAAACACIVLSAAVLLKMPQGATDKGSMATDGMTEKSGQQVLKQEEKDQTAMQEEEPLPEAIYIKDSCYKRTEDETEYQEEKLAFLGELQEKGSSLFADNWLLDIPVYRIDAERIMIRLNGTCHTYRK